MANLISKDTYHEIENNLATRISKDLDSAAENFVSTTVNGDLMLRANRAAKGAYIIKERTMKKACQKYAKRKQLALIQRSWSQNRRQYVSTVAYLLGEADFKVERKKYDIIVTHPED